MSKTIYQADDTVTKLVCYIAVLFMREISWRGSYDLVYLLDSISYESHSSRKRAYRLNYSYFAGKTTLFTCVVTINKHHNSHNWDYGDVEIEYVGKKAKGSFKIDHNVLHIPLVLFSDVKKFK